MDPLFLLFASFFAGVLTSLAPCILPLLPVIVGSSVVGNKTNRNKWKPYVISLSLAMSVVVFSFILKATSLLINVDPSVWIYLSGTIVILLGINLLFPNLWIQISSRIGFESGSNRLLNKSTKKSGVGGAILTGAALGPVFSSCSPVYALVIATILPSNLLLGMFYITYYAIGLGAAMLVISLIGRKLIDKLKWAVDPNGLFHKILAIILIVVGLMIVTGYDKKFQTWVSPYLPFDTNLVEQNLLPAKADKSAKQAVSKDQNIQSIFGRDGTNKPTFNVTPYPAPEITGILEWINSKPTSIAALKGKVVLIDFWTFDCINCRNTQPYINQWYDKYKGQDFEIIGVHAPELSFEKVPANVRKAVVDANIKYPVALDNDFTTWNAYGNQFWPARYVIDKDSNVRYEHFGEGAYDTTDQIIQTLLNEQPSKN